MQKSMARVQRVSSLDYEKNFKDKVCLITGATGGIGKAVCRRLIQAGTLLPLAVGAIVIMIGRTMQKIERVVKEFRDQGIVIRDTHFLYKNMDFNEPSNVEKDFQNLMLKTKGRLDVIVNAAGVVNRKSLKQATLVDWDKSTYPA